MIKKKGGFIIHQKENKRKGEKGAYQYQKTLMITTRKGSRFCILQNKNIETLVPVFSDDIPSAA
jgi:hypothetical protein